MFFPATDYKQISAESTRALSGYYTDNLISFNVARIFTEARSITNTVVVPVWSFFDRTPIAGALVAFFWYVFGIRENAAWLGSSPGNFFYYQEQLIVLNLLSVFALGCFLLRRGKKVLPTIAILLLGPFVFLNLGFAWPKFFSAFFAIVALDFLSFLIDSDKKLGKEYFISGFLLGMAYLTHESAIFFIASLFAVFVLARFVSVRFLNFKQILLLFLGLFTAVSPWFALRFFYEEKSSHMLALHLFCVTDLSYQNMTTRQALLEYLKNNSLRQILKVKLGNIFYPFSIVDAFKSVQGDYFNFLSWLRVLTTLSKYQLIHAISLPAFLVSIWGLIKWLTRKDLVWLFVIAGVVSVFPAAMLFGCEKSTWNHTWIYTSVLLLAFPLEQLISRSNVSSFFLVICGLILFINQLIMEVDFFTVAGAAYLFWLFMLFCMLGISICIFGEKCELQ